MNIDDILCVLRAFTADYSGCSLHAADLAGASPDGIADLDDVLAVLAAFAGTPYPESEPQGCPSETCPDIAWTPGVFNFGDVYGPVNALTVYDDGSGPGLYAAGRFTSAGEVNSRSVARWDGRSWQKLGSGLYAPLPPGTAYALAVYDDGSGPALYVGGVFTSAGGLPVSNIAKWSGGSWSAVGDGLNGTVRALVVFDDGNGPSLYAGGDFTASGAETTNYTAKWNGVTWSALGSGADGTVRSLAVCGAGGQTALYAAGDFLSVDGVQANRIARWDGNSWSALGDGIDNSGYSLAAFEDGNGTALYVGGQFLNAGNGEARHVARWDGSTWSEPGMGINGTVEALSVIEHGGGAMLYAGGTFTEAGGNAALRIASWNGLSWASLGAGLSGVAPTARAVAYFDDGSGAALFVGGSFNSAGTAKAENVARWNGSSWSALERGVKDWVRDLVVWDDGNGAALYATGEFVWAGGVQTNYVARWNGSSWSALGTGLNYNGHVLAVFDDGGGPALYVGGEFTSAGGVTTNRIAKWDGSVWSSLGDGVTSTDPFRSVHALQVFDDGTGPALYVGGEFTIAGGAPAGRIARWDGAAWSPLANGISGGNPRVFALAVFDDGMGPALYVGGTFSQAGNNAGNVEARGIAKWDGASWSGVGGGVLGSSSFAGALSMEVFDDGNRAALYVSGPIDTAGGVPVQGIAKWDGTTWSALLGAPSTSVAILKVVDVGNGMALFGVASASSTPGDASLVQWNGVSWSTLPGGLGHPNSPPYVSALAVFDDGTGAGVYAGGFFHTANGVSARNMARWGCPR